MVTVNFYQLNELDSKTTLALLELRQNVFILEQDCLYPDIDSIDRTAIHGLIMVDNNLAGCVRILPPQITDENQNPTVKIGRFALNKSFRKKEIGKQLFQAAIDHCQSNFPNSNIEISAQQPLEGYYQSFGFKTISEPYDEDGILHLTMIFYKKKAINDPVQAHNKLD